MEKMEELTIKTRVNEALELVRKEKDHLATLDDYQGSAIGVCNVLCEYGAISSIHLKTNPS